VRRDVERGIADRDALGGQAAPGVVRHLLRRPLLDRDPVAGRRREVERRGGRGHVERDPVLLRQHRDRVRTDLVGDVPVGRDAVGADDDRVDLSA
jgi:hypothetical protein